LGEARRKLLSNKKFLSQHSLCCLCGGTVPATTIEHAPPKVFFVNKEVPAATHRVPACERCNSGSSNRDQVAALFALTQATVHRGIPDSYMNKLILGVRNNAPSAFAALIGGASTDVPLRVAGQIDLYSRVEVDNSIFTDWLNPWAAKQAYALYYLHSDGRILPNTSRVVVQWFTNAHVVEGQSPDNLLRALPNYGDLRQGVRNSELQYSYKWQLDDELGCFVLMLHDSSMVMLGIFHDPSKAAEVPRWTLFATNAEDGIRQVNPASSV
jgi:hypothetical protein